MQARELANSICDALQGAGFEAFLVGGCVRDILLKREPADYDVATSATPDEVLRLFPDGIAVGKEFGVMVVPRNGIKVEVATFRSDIGYTDGRHPDRVVYASSPKEDVQRRDFTINGLFYDVAEGRVIDFVGGLRDMRLREVRTIGDPEIRMREDPVRILRAVRFACKLDFDIESRTYAAMEGAVEDIPRCAPPRLLEDTFRILRGGVSAGGLHLLFALDALKFLLPPVDAWLKERGAEGASLLRAHAERLDARVRSGAVLEDSVLLATLLLPLLRSPPPPTARQGPEPAPTGAGSDAPAPAEGEETSPSVPPAVEDLLQELVRTARLPRRIAERCRMILLAQATLSGQRRRRGGLASFRRHPLFQEALTVFELSVEATGEHRAALDAWRSGGVPTPPAGGSPSEGGRRRRRRRRRGPRAGSPPGAGN